MDLHRAVGSGSRQPDHRGHRAQPHDHGQRHRAHRVRIARRLFDHQDFLSAEREYPDGHCAGRRERTVAIASIAARHPAAAGDQILGIQHPDHPTRAIQPHHDRTGRLRCRGELLASPARHHSGCGGTVALRRKTARHFGRPRHQCTARQGPDPERHSQCGQHAKSGVAVRNRQDRSDGVRARHQWFSGHHRRAQQYPGGDPKRRDHLSLRGGACARRLLAAD
jgi:hypothetical protein